MKISFHGAARMVTGSKHLITTDKGVKVLLDCGLFQGMGAETDVLNRHFGFDPTEIDFLFLSHAHIDHSGLIPRLVKLGFKGKIFCTPATFDLCRLMLSDSAVIQEYDIKYINKRRKKKKRPSIEVLYNLDDVNNCLKIFNVVNYSKWHRVTDDISIMFTDSGHILGSAAINLVIKEKESQQRICFTGDIGRQGDPILKQPEAFSQADYIICESTYGNRIHEPIKDSELRLLEIVKETCVDNKAKLIIPAFSLDRTQELIYALDQMEHLGELPAIKVFVDSPLSVETTKIVEKHVECYNENVREYMQVGDKRPFYFKNLHYITKVEHSKALNDLDEPCIIISSSGMAEAGRVKHHIKNNISDSKNTILIVGYCTPSSLGGRLRNGNKVVRIFGEEYDVKAKVATIDSYSAHADYNEILSYLDCQKKDDIKKVFLVHGDYDVMLDFQKTLNEKGYKDVYIPKIEEEVKL